MSDDKKPEEVDNKLMDHDYDGIQELDNDLPAWWQGIFYVTILFSLLYWLVYHVAQDGNIMENEYRQAVKEHQLAVQNAGMDFASLSDEQKKEVRLKKGATIFSQKCATCHGVNAASSKLMVGPNLTDSHFIHGGDLENIKRIIADGVLEKGMLAWKGQLSSEEILSVATYVHSLKGTNVAGGKEPQGIEEK